MSLKVSDLATSDYAPTGGGYFDPERTLSCRLDKRLGYTERCISGGASTLETTEGAAAALRR